MRARRLKFGRVAQGTRESRSCGRVARVSFRVRASRAQATGESPRLRASRLLFLELPMLRASRSGFGRAAQEDEQGAPKARQPPRKNEYMNMEFSITQKAGQIVVIMFCFREIRSMSLLKHTFPLLFLLFLQNPRLGSC